MGSKSNVSRSLLRRGLAIITWRMMEKVKCIVPCLIACSLFGVSAVDSASYSNATLQNFVFESEGLPLSTALPVKEIQTSDYRPVAFLGAPGITGDFNCDGVVDKLDIDLCCSFFGSTPATGSLAPFDLIADNVIDFLDLEELIVQHVDVPVTAMNPTGKGTCIGDLNCDGTVSILGDAFMLLGNFGSTGTPGGTISYAQGDVNCDGTVDINDVFILVTNIGSPC